MKIQPLMALVVLSLPTVPGARAAARTLVPGLFTLACLLVAAPATAQVSYGVSNNTAYVAGGCTYGNIVIASTYNGYPVTRIVDQAFYMCYNPPSGPTSVTIPDSVTSIGNQAFFACIHMTNAIIGNGVTHIGDSAFDYCSTLAQVTIGNSVTNIGTRVFSECSQLASVTIPNSVTSIGGLAFYNCASLTSATIPNGVTSIGASAFYQCRSLKSVTIPDSVTSSIGDYTFTGCTSLTNVTIPNGVTSIGYRAFSGCTNLTSVTIPNSVTGIGDEAFSGCASLKSVTIGNSVTNIGPKAFSGCTSVTNLLVDAANPAYSSLDGVLFDKAQMTLIVFPLGRAGSYVIPNRVARIVDGAFTGCTRLTNVTIPNSVTNIGQAFTGCTSLRSVAIPNSVTDIGYRAFVRCTSLASVTIPNSVTNIAASAFIYCGSLTSVTIPNSVRKIGVEAFVACTNLTNVTFLGNAPELGYFVEFAGWFYGVGAAARAYYYCGTTGWGTKYGELPTVTLFAPRIAPGSAGMKPGGFGFTLTCLTNQTVVEASANLVNWQPIWTNTVPGASAEFVDPEWVNHPRRFYRARAD